MRIPGPQTQRFWFGKNMNFLFILIQIYRASLVAQLVKNLPAMQEIQIQSLGQEDSLEKEMAAHSSILPGESHGQRSQAGYTVRGIPESDTTVQLTFTFTLIDYIVDNIVDLQYCAYLCSRKWLRFTHVYILFLNSLLHYGLFQEIWLRSSFGFSVRYQT